MSLNGSRLRLNPKKKKNTMKNLLTQRLILSLLIITLYPLSIQARPFILVLSQDDIKDSPASPDDDLADWEEFGDSETKPDENLDPGSWSPIFEPGMDPDEPYQGYYSTVSKMMAAASAGESRVMEEAVSEIEAVSGGGDPNARSLLAFLYGMGMTRERNKAKAFLYHHFAAEGGNIQSKMALAYSYLRQDVSSRN
jgi:SEL1 protein